MSKREPLPKIFDKYAYYTRAVQSPDADVEFLRDCYRELNGKLPKTLREDFCGTFANSCAWVKLHKEFSSYGIDLDEEPIGYGKKHHLSALSEEQQQRIHLLHANVLDQGLPVVDIIAAMNFYKSLNPEGLLIADCFGGSQCYEALEEETDHGDFSYFWDLDEFNPVNNQVKYYIHFKLKNEKEKREKCFSYDWRMWSITEIREVMEEVGFKNTYVYWEGTTDQGEGDGCFQRTERGEECEAWIAYIVGQKV